MNEELLTRIEHDERYQHLARSRARFAWLLTSIMSLAFFSYIGLIAFDKELLATPIGDGVTSLGIPLGFGLILLAILLTGIYVRRANTEFDGLTSAIIAEVEE